MRRTSTALALGVALVAAIPQLADGAIPSPGNSYVAAHVVVCPAGDSMLVVVARGFTNNPWSDGPIWADFCNCPGFRLSPTPAPCAVPDTSHCKVTLTPDPYGVVEIPVSGGGLCPGGSVRVYAQGILLAIRGEPACFDQNGDLVVDTTDVAIVGSKMGTSDPSADFDGDGKITQQDLGILQHHLGHASPDAVPPAARNRVAPTGR